MGQIQAVITVLGDIYLLKIYCVHPGIFMLTASLVSFAFTLLIYTLTLSFGDVGCSRSYSDCWFKWYIPY